MKHYPISITIVFAFLSVFFIYCEKNNEETNTKSLKLKNSYSLDVPEPSGLSFTSGNTTLYTVSDHTGYIYKISLQGKLFSTIKCDARDLEGVTYDSENKNIWVVEERNRKLLKLDLQGNILKEVTLNISSNDENKGLEGLTFNSTNKHFYCLNEANPGLLIELDENQQKINEYELKFAEDYSGIFYDKVINNIWIVSDKSSTITKCDLEGNKIETYNLGINKAEGVVVDSDNNKIYVISDSAEKLYVFEF